MVLYRPTLKCRPQQKITSLLKLTLPVKWYYYVQYLVVRQKLPYTVRSYQHELILLVQSVVHRLRFMSYSHRLWNVISERPTHRQSLQFLGYIICTSFWQPDSVWADAVSLFVPDFLYSASALQYSLSFFLFLGFMVIWQSYNFPLIFANSH